MMVAKLSAVSLHVDPENLLFKNYKVLQMFMNDYYWITRVPMISVLVFIICLIRIASMSLEALYKQKNILQRISFYFGNEPAHNEMEKELHPCSRSCCRNE